MEEELREYFVGLCGELEKVRERVKKLEEEKEMKFLKRRRKPI